MKIVAIGDIHGRDFWKTILAKNLDADKIIFIGDYFDTWQDVSTQEQIDNFQSILEVKKFSPEKVIVLMGNHDYHYIMDGEEYSGFQDDGAEAIGTVVGMALSEGLMDKAYANGDFLFTHAGVTKSWSESVGISGVEAKRIDMLINELPLESFKFYRGDSSGYGENILQSPIWVRPQSLQKDLVQGYKQVVGHTTEKSLEVEANPILIDTLGAAQYLVIEDGKPRAETIWKL